MGKLVGQLSGREEGVGRLSCFRWAKDEFRCRLVPEGGGGGEIFLVVARLGCAFDFNTIDVEVAGAVGCRRRKSSPKILPLASYRVSRTFGDVGDNSAVNRLCRYKEGVEELGELVEAYGRGKGVPEDGVDLFEAVGGVWDVEDAGDRDGLGIRSGSF
jgi:hypothetical protein